MGTSARPSPAITRRPRRSALGHRPAAGPATAARPAGAAGGPPAPRGAAASEKRLEAEPESRVRPRPASVQPQRPLALLAGQREPERDRSPRRAPGRDAPTQPEPVRPDGVPPAPPISASRTLSMAIATGLQPATRLDPPREQRQREVGPRRQAERAPPSPTRPTPRRNVRIAPGADQPEAPDEGHGTPTNTASAGRHAVGVEVEPEGQARSRASSSAIRTRHEEQVEGGRPEPGSSPSRSAWSAAISSVPIICSWRTAVATRWSAGDRVHQAESTIPMATNSM